MRSTKQQVFDALCLAAAYEIWADRLSAFITTVHHLQNGKLSVIRKVDEHAHKLIETHVRLLAADSTNSEVRVSCTP